MSVDLLVVGFVHGVAFGVPMGVISSIWPRLFFLLVTAALGLIALLLFFSTPAPMGAAMNFWYHLPLMFGSFVGSMAGARMGDVIL